jgi:hypothetical protein
MQYYEKKLFALSFSAAKTIHLGRNFLNRLAHLLFDPSDRPRVPIDPNDQRGYDSFDGRITVAQPGYPCQVCRQLISPQRMLDEGMRRSDPQRYGQYRRAGYVVRDGDPSPVVVTFTTEIAAVAVNELLHRLPGFRGLDRHCAERVRRFDWIKDADGSANAVTAYFGRLRRIHLRLRLKAADAHRETATRVHGFFPRSAPFIEV